MAFHKEHDAKNSPGSHILKKEYAHREALMNSQKTENLLNLALDSTEEERKKISEPAGGI